MKQMKSRSKRKIFVRTPGSRITIHYKDRRPQAAHCAGCGSTLKGVPRKTVSNLSKIPKSQRRPERPYGGVLCSSCNRVRIKTIIRS